MATRQPIVTVCGHVDHGKTSILDKLRSSCVQEAEAGGITQKISFTLYPIGQLKCACPLIEKSGIDLSIPGFLLIDTPGHAAFTNLRKRGGSLADLAVLVIDINEGIKPQTAEVISILKKNKTPFIIALNKIDNISGWRKSPDMNIKDSIEAQQPHVKQVFDERYMTLAGALHSHGFDADLYYEVEDFSKKIAMVPCSAESGEGISELIMMLCGLSEKYLKNGLSLGKDAKGVVLEIKKDNSLNFAEAILYDGTLTTKDEIVIANIEGDPIVTKIRILEEIQPLCAKFKPVNSATASTGLKMQLVDKSDILPGMPFEILKGNLDEIKKRFKKEIGESIKTEKQGIIAKADSLGSLEALLVLLSEQNISVVKAGIGEINKNDIASAKANVDINEIDSVIVGFNVELDDEAKEIKGKIKTISNGVVYKLIDDLVDWRKKKQAEIEKKRMMGLATITKLEILHQHVFRNTSPAIFGVRVMGGNMVTGLNLVDEAGEKVGKIKNIQSEQKSVTSATDGMEVATSIPGVNFERRLASKKFLYSDLGESQFREFKKNKDLLSPSEIKILQEIAEIKRKEKSEWGM
jgi:translation initiation factor 5B